MNLHESYWCLIGAYSWTKHSTTNLHEFTRILLVFDWCLFVDNLTTKIFFSMKLIYENEVYTIIGACYEVYNELHCGLSEAIYQEALEREFLYRGVPYMREVPLDVYYKGEKLRKRYIADFVCYDDIIVELKAVDLLTKDHVSQVLNYLHITKYPLGLLINFGHKIKLEWNRYVNI